MKGYEKDLKGSQTLVTLADFMLSFNKNMPSSFPRVTKPLLLKFKKTHEALFKNGDLWSLDLHRKKLIDWLPRNLENSVAVPKK